MFDTELCTCTMYIHIIYEQHLLLTSLLMGVATIPLVTMIGVVAAAGDVAVVLKLLLFSLIPLAAVVTLIVLLLFVAAVSFLVGAVASIADVDDTAAAAAVVLFAVASNASLSIIRSQTYLPLPDCTVSSLLTFNNTNNNSCYRKQQN